MGAFKELVRREAPSAGSFADYFRWNVKKDEIFDALPILNLPDRLTNHCKEIINDGSSRWSCSKVVAYLGYRAVTYSFIPTLFNLISTITSLALTIITLPLALCCEGKITRWCWVSFQGSLGYLAQNVCVDLTCDVRQVTGLLFRISPDSSYRTV